MKNNQLITLVMSLGITFSSLAADYVVPFDEVVWHANKQADHCQLYSEDETSGLRISFDLFAGQKIAAIISGRSAVTFGEGFMIETIPPLWGSSHYEMTAINQFEKGKTQIKVTEGANFLYRDIQTGAWITLRDLFHSVTFPTANIQDALAVFRTCSSDLPPIDFVEAQTTVFHYPNGVTGLTREQREQINEIAQLILSDARIKTVLIEGHSDNRGDHVVNLRVSKRRATDVAYWLVMAGVPKSMIEIRGQGGRYPIANNNSDEGRQENRRVVVELIRK